MTRLKRVLIYGGVIYLWIGLILGSAMAFAIPAMNPLGVGYYALTWPAFVASGTLDTPAPPVPAWAFTFEDQT
jgi:hypothetical protein